LLVPEQSNFNDGSGVKDFKNIDATPQKYTCIQQRILSGLKFTGLTFKLTHITFNHGAFELSFGS
jgi:hypothetical protein